MKRLVAFTLVELLVVVGIIAILAALLMPGLAKARDAAIRLDCVSKLKQLGVSFSMYVGELKTYPGQNFPQWSAALDDNGYTIIPADPDDVSPKDCRLQCKVFMSRLKNGRAYLYNALLGGYKFSTIQDCSGTIVLTEAGQAWSWAYTWTGNLPYGTQPRISKDTHWSGVNNLYVDSHVQWLKSSNLTAGMFTPKAGD